MKKKGIVLILQQEFCLWLFLCRFLSSSRPKSRYLNYFCKIRLWRLIEKYKRT